MGLQLARHGARVGLFARRRERLEQLVRQIDKGGGQALALSGDVTRRDQVHQAVERLVSEFGPVDVLIANAGLGSPRGGETDAPTVADVLNVNFLGAVYALEAVLPSMQERGSGHVAAVSSAVALLPRITGNPTYAASKEALGRYFEGLSPRLKRDGISVTVIYPGFVHTEMTARNKTMPFVMTADEAARRMARAIAQGRKRLIFPRRTLWLGRIAQLIPARFQPGVQRCATSRSGQANQ